MQKFTSILAVAATVSLTACGSKTDANEKNFGAAMSQYFDKKGDLCLNTKQWPVEVTEMDLRMEKALKSGSAARMGALQSVGLVKGEDVEVDIMGIMGKPTGAKAKVKRYSLTDAAKPFAQEKDVESIGLNGRTTVHQTDLCWGKKALDKIVKWEGPMKLGDYQEASITYTYKVDHTASWATKPEVQATFPAIKSILDGAGKSELKHGVKLTSQGWEAKGLDSAF